MKFKTQPITISSPIRKIFFVGVKGVGNAPLALIAKEAGLDIAGSDIGEEFITDLYLLKKDIILFEGFKESDMLNFFGDSKIAECLVITTGAHRGYDNPQVIAAKNKGFAVLTQGQALSFFMSGEIFNRHTKGIAVAGSHGKTTISSLLATTMKALGLDPSYTVGTGEIFPLGAPGHYGNGDYFVAEADEYVSEPVYDRVPKFLYQAPFYAIFNNIDFDHPDQFGDIDDVKKAFFEFAHNIKSGGVLFLNGDDRYLKDFPGLINKDIRIITYGEASTNDYTITKIVSFGLKTQFTVLKKGAELGHFELRIPGKHNAKNALAVISLLTEIGFDPQQIRICVTAYEGTKRRSEIVGHTKSGAVIIDDYGHHPLEISTTLSAIKEAYQDKKLVCVFQPHTYSRTKALLSDFSNAFKNADELLLLPVFKSLRDTENDNLPKEALVNAFRKNQNTRFFENFDNVVEYISQNYTSKECVIVTIGAGDVYKIAYALKNS